MDDEMRSGARQEAAEQHGPLHFKNAEEDFKKAEELFNGDRKPIPHPNVEFQSPLNQAWDYALNALNALEYAEKDNGASTEELVQLKEKIIELIGKIKVERKGAKN